MTENLRTCSRCKTPKPLDEYPRDASQSGGFSFHCRGCDRERKKERRGTLGKHRDREALAREGKKRCSKCGDAKERGEFRPKASASDGLQSWCRGCQNEASKEAMRKKAPALKEARKKATSERAPRPAPLSGKERSARWRNAHPERHLGSQLTYTKSDKGKLTHRLASSRRRARMNGVLKREEWAAIKAAWGHRCAYCKAAMELTIEHVVPVSAGGPNVAGNVVPACKPCNDCKSDAPLDIALARLGANPFWWKARRWFADRAVRAEVAPALS